MKRVVSSVVIFIMLLNLCITTVFAEGFRPTEDKIIDMHFSAMAELSGEEVYEFGSADLFFVGRASNTTAQDADGVVIVACFDEGELKYADCRSVTVKAGSTADVAIQVYNKIGMDTIKGYLCIDGVENMGSFATATRKKVGYDPLFDGSLLSMSPKTYDAKTVIDEFNKTAEAPLPTTGISEFENVETIFYDGIEYKDKDAEKSETKKVWAYVAKPEGASVENPVPGIVLVHGGGGTAYDKWAKLWADKGYAAIALDTEGRMPVKTDTFSSAGRMFTGFGHQNNASYKDFTPDDEEHYNMWFYQAICDIVLAGNVLRGYDWVDSSSIGITGISYGALLTIHAIGADNRFSFAVPVYASGYLGESATYFKNIMTEEKRSWDPSRFYIQSGNMPILLIVSNRDQNFALDTVSKTYLDVYHKAQLVIVNNFSHSENMGSIIGAAPNWGITQEKIDSLSATMIEFIKNADGDEGAVGLSKISPFSVNGREIKATVTLPDGIDPAKGKAQLRYLTVENYSDCFLEVSEGSTNWILGGDGEKNNFDYNWPVADAKVEGENITVVAPNDATYCYIEYTDARGFTTATEMVKLK